MARTASRILPGIVAVVAATTSSAFAQSEPDPLGRANAAYKAKDYERAIDLYRKILKREAPAKIKGKAIYNLGLAYKALDRYTEAIKTFKMMFEAGVNDREPGGSLMEAYRNYRPKAQWEIANCLFEQKKYREALEAYGRTQTEYPFRSWCGNAQAEYKFRYAFYRGLCHEWLGEHVVAVRLYFDSIEQSAGLYSNPDVHRRIVDLYQASGQMEGLRQLLDARESRRRSEIRRRLPVGTQISDERLKRTSPWRITHRVIDIRSMAEREDWAGLVALLKIKGTVAGPDEAYARRGNFEAVEAANLLAASVEKTVPLLIARLDEVNSQDMKWVYYALGRCGTPAAVGALKSRAMKETNCWWTNAVVYSISLAGRNGERALNELTKVAGGNLARSIERHREGTLGQADQEIRFPPLGDVELLPVSPGELPQGPRNNGEATGGLDAHGLGPLPEPDPKHRALVDGLDAILGFDKDTSREEVLAFRKLVETDIPAKGKEMIPALWDKMRRTSHPRVFAYAVRSMSAIEGLSREGKRELERVMKAEFPGFRSALLRTEEGRLKVIRRLRRFFAERPGVEPDPGRQAE